MATGPTQAPNPDPAAAVSAACVLGVISDTHGLLRPEALAALRGSTLILHAGDVGGPKVLEELRAMAPVVAVRGNVDRAAWAQDLPEQASLRIAGCGIHLLHNLRDWDGATATDCRVVVSGHSHKPRMAWKGGVLYFNPGSAGPRRFRLPVAVGRLRLADGIVRGEILDLSRPAGQ